MNSGFRLMLTFLGCSLVLIQCRNKESYEKPLVPVQIEAVSQRVKATGARYSANIVPAVRVDLAFRVGGYVRELLKVKGSDGTWRAVQEGDIVSRGTVLVRLREADYQEKVKQAQSQLAQAKAGWEQAKGDFARVEALFNKQSLTKREYDGAKAAFEAAQARMEGAQALLEEANLALRDSALRAPIDGLIIKRLVEIGSLVGPGMPAFILADTSSVKAVFGAPDIVVRSLQVGTPLSITTDAISGVVFPGHISAVSPAADPKSRVFEVEVTIPNPELKLKAGMVASVQLDSSELAQPVNVVPLTAIVRSKTNASGFAVFVVSAQEGKEIAHLRDVDLGDPLGNAISVTKGLQTGDRVVVRGNTLISDGEEVRVVP